ncbi:ribonuclease H2 subunit C protein [Rutstroemia sp. NJR-2017a BVV2]|nr:ribonuclease H2 subunit C protein [Rutstroemia sp. NJR-2017a BVV2]
MLAIRPPQPTKTGAGIQKNKHKKFTPNLLPCRVNYTARIPVAKRYWDPRVRKVVPVGKEEKAGEDGGEKELDDGKEEADTAENKPNTSRAENEKEELVSYFRGRKFTGRKVAVPAGYRGFVGKVGEEVLPVLEEGEGEEEEKQVETKIMEELGGFDEIVVWGHEGVSDVGGEGVVRGVEEWIEWAGKVC